MLCGCTVLCFTMKLKDTFLTLRNVTLQIYKYFDREAKRGRLYHSLSSPQKRTRDVLGISRRSLVRCLKEAGDATVTSRDERRGRHEKFDDFDKDVVRREIVNMFSANKLVTLRKLKKWLQEHNDIHISKTALWKIVRSVGFTFRKSTSGRNVLCEKPDLVSARSRYLREVRERRQEGYDIVYLDESWVNAHHTNQKEWQSTDGVERRRVPSSKGQRIIMAHAGSRHRGLIDNAELIFQSKSTDNRDYHSEMNGHIFRDWIDNTLIPSLDRPSCLVMDNASYHNVVEEQDRIPTSSSTKDTMKMWLKKESIPFKDTQLKPELFSLVKQTKKTKTFGIDKIIQSHGHTCLRLPPYHSHLNPIELVWAKVKGQVASENTTFKLCDIKALTRTAILGVDKALWAKCEDHVLREEENYWNNEGLWFIQPRTVINLLDSSDTD